MSNLHIRSLFVALALLAVGLATASANAPAAQAQSPQGVHILHLPQWYAQQEQPNLPNVTKNLKYYGGQVMVAGSTTYAIYWVPAGHSVDPNYESLINRYFSDIGGSSFFKIVTQYYQNPGKKHIVNHSALGGFVVDTTPYPAREGHCR